MDPLLEPLVADPVSDDSCALLQKRTLLTFVLEVSLAGDHHKLRPAAWLWYPRNIATPLRCRATRLPVANSCPYVLLYTMS
jgi:hypothetical protein